MHRKISLTMRLTGLHTLISTSILLGLGWLIFTSIEQHFIEMDREVLQNKISLTKEIINKKSSQEDLQKRLDEVFKKQNGLFVNIENKNGSIIYATADFPHPETPIEEKSTNTTKTFNWQHGKNKYRGLQIDFKKYEYANALLKITVALDTQDQSHKHFTHRFQETLIFYILLATFFSTLLSWISTWQGLRPLRSLKANVAAVTVSKLDQRIPVDAFPIEMADLAATLNQMLNRLQEAFNRLSEFSSDLAHELRTPLSNLMTQTQVALSQERSNHEYHEILASNIEELQRLAQTVSDMLFLAKAENGLDLPTRKLFSVKDEIAILFEFYNILAAEKSIVLEFFGNAQVMGDGPMFRRAISNLLSNAFRFTPNFGKIMVEVESTAKTVTVHVENTGDNINEKLLPFLFDRFFRADKSRPHLSSDGTGLGLSITRAIVEAHGGKISVISAQGKTRFSLLFMRNTP